MGVGGGGCGGGHAGLCRGSMWGVGVGGGCKGSVEGAGWVWEVGVGRGWV